MAVSASVGTPPRKNSIVARASRSAKSPNSSDSVPKRVASARNAADTTETILALGDGGLVLVSNSTAPTSRAVTTGLVRLPRYDAARSVMRSEERRVGKGRGPQGAPDGLGTVQPHGGLRQDYPELQT